MFGEQPLSKAAFARDRVLPAGAYGERTTRSSVPARGRRGRSRVHIVAGTPPPDGRAGHRVRAHAPEHGVPRRARPAKRRAGRPWRRSGRSTVGSRTNGATPTSSASSACRTSRCSMCPRRAPNSIGSSHLALEAVEDQAAGNWSPAGRSAAHPGLRPVLGSPRTRRLVPVVMHLDNGGYTEVFSTAWGDTRRTRMNDM